MAKPRAKGTKAKAPAIEVQVGGRTPEPIPEVNEAGQVTGFRTDSNGNPLTDLAGYKIHYGRMSGIYDYEITIDNPGILTYVVENLYPGDWYFSMTAFDRNGTESGYSNEVRKRVQ